jgi:anti-anti-sigma regulatory factor
MGFFDLLRKKAPTRSVLPPFILRVEEVRGVRILRLNGDVGKSIGKEVQDAEGGSEKAGDYCKNVLFDFEQVTTCDFSTIAYLVNSLRKHAGHSTRVGIIKPGDMLNAELEISKLDPLFECFASEEEAIEAFAPTSL